MQRDRSNLRILVVSTQFPLPPTSGFAMRVYQLTRGLARTHDVTLLTYASDGQEGAAGDFGSEFPVEIVARRRERTVAKRARQVVSLASPRPYHCHAIYSGDMQQAIRRLCRTTRFDLVQVESSVLCAFGLPSAAPLVIDEHNVEYEVFSRMCKGERSVARRTFNGAEYLRFRRFERRWWRRASGCAVTSPREAQIVRQHAPGAQVEVVPNGVDLEYFAPPLEPARQETMVFNGLLEYRPNLDAAQHLVDEIWPLVLREHPRARLTIVGRGPEAELRRLRGRNVTVTGEVPDVRPYLRSAAVVAVPVRIGGGTRLKVVEALAMGKPVVSTRLGCEGIDVEHGRHLVVADGPDRFAAEVVALFSDAARARALGAEGRALMTARYSWDASVRRLEALHERVLTSHGLSTFPTGEVGFSHVGEAASAGVDRLTSARGRWCMQGVSRGEGGNG